VAYVPELDDGRQEVRKGYASNSVRYWPKVPGSGNVAVTGTPTFDLEKPDGTSISTGTSVTVTDTGTFDRLDLTIDATSYDLGEDFKAVITWNDGTINRDERLYFDCVTEPFANSVSLNDFTGLEADATKKLTALGAEQVAARTAESVASVLGWRAWQDDVRPALRRKAEQDSQTYPQMIINREDVHRAVMAFAMARMYRLEGAADEESDNFQLEQKWQRMGQFRLESMPALRFSADQDGEADTSLPRMSQVTLRRRAY